MTQREEGTSDSDIGGNYANNGESVTVFDAKSSPGLSSNSCHVVRHGIDLDIRVDDRIMGRYPQFAVTATAEALEDAGFDSISPDWDSNRVGTSVGLAVAGLSGIEIAAGARSSPSFLVTALANPATAHDSICIDARGTNRTPGTACSAGTHAIGTATDDIRRGRADVAVAGGTGAAISPLGVEP